MTSLDVRSHAFNVGIAMDYSPSVALFIGHLAYWAEKNLTNNQNIHDGLVWSYDTLDALCEQFPYFTRRQIETVIKNCVEAGLVVKGNYNQTQYDRTCWYALTPQAYDYFPHLSSEKNVKRLFLSISQNCEMDFAEWGNRFTHFVTPIPDTDPDTDPNTTTTKNIDSIGDEKSDKTKESSGSSSFNSFEKDCLKIRIESDKRTEEEFLKNVHHHIENNSDKSKPLAMRQKMIITLLKWVKQNGLIFESVGFISEQSRQQEDNNKKSNRLERLKAQWENYYNSDIEKRCRANGYPSKTLEQWIKDHE